MPPPPDPWMVQLLAVCLYLAIVVIGFAGTALGHGLLGALLSLTGLDILLAP